VASSLPICLNTITYFETRL
jgi:hypothetical protein